MSKTVKRYTHYFLLVPSLFFCLTISAGEFSDHPDSNLHKRIDAYLTDASDNGFSGAVLVAKEGNVILNRGYGFADKIHKISNTPTTIFDVGSVTKQFTAAAILKLEEKHKLKVTDTLSQYFNHLPADKKEITIHQLLTHSSGIIGGIGNGDFHHIPTKDYFAQLFATDLLHPPGSKHYYSNAGYSVLARIIELVSGQEYEHFIRKELFAPAGMNDTGYLLPAWQKFTQAKGYQYNIFDIGSMTKRYIDDGKISWVLKGNGGINSTQEDMYRWYLALQNHQILSPASIKKLTAPHIKEYDDGDSYYAYGWAIFNSPRDTKVVAHNGSNGTFYYDFVWMPEERTVILFATNTLTRPLPGIPNQIEKILFDESYQAKPLKKDFMVSILNDAIAHHGDSDSLVKLIQSNYAKQLSKRHYLNRLGITLQKNGQVEKAIGLFKLNIHLFPGDGNLWDSLGEAYFSANQLKKSKAAFEKAIELKSPTHCYWCDNSQAKLDLIKQKLAN